MGQSPQATSQHTQHTLKTDDRTNIRDAVSISERPATAEDRAIPGHWEGDLLFGNANSQIATLVERQTRFVMLVKIASKDSEAVVNALIKHAGKLPQELYKSLTWGRGTEMAGHKRFTVATDIKVYFCGVSRTQVKACDAVSKMGEGLPKSACRSRLQTARCCLVQKAWW